MTLEATRDAVQHEIEQMWPVIAQAQSDRLAAHGTYLQRLPTHTTFPHDGTPRNPDNVEDKPTDESEDGTEYMSFPALTWTCCTIHVWAKGEDQGYDCYFEFDWTLTGMRQRYTIHGPGGASDGWTEYDPDAIGALL